MTGKMKVPALGLLAVVCLASAFPTENNERKSYKGYKVLQLRPGNEEGVDLIRQWEETYLELDFWSPVRGINDVVDVMVPPGLINVITEGAHKAGIAITILNDRVQEELDEEYLRLEERFAKSKAYDKTDFNTHDEVIGEMQNLARNHCPTSFECEIYTIGTSYLGESLRVLRVMQPMEVKQAFWVDSTIHAREWLATATNMNILDHMLKNYNTDPKVTFLMNKYDWYFMPIVNPDGYKYSWTNDRYQRKNRRPFGSCVGVDLNRNFDYRWGEIGVSTNPCAQTFCGDAPASEPETRAVQQEISVLGSGLGTNLIGLVSIHTYGYMFMHPWGHKVDGRCARAADHQDMYNVAEAAARAIGETYRTSWSYGTSCEVIYATAGSTADWAKAVGGVKYSFTPELRGTGFVISRIFIRTSFQEVFNGFYAMAQQIVAEESKHQN